MRVIAGEKRHMNLLTLDSLDIRPTTDKIKETLFNIIQFDLNDINFLDLFAGSGAIGIEALSRGAKTATFVEINRKAVDVINYNLEKTGLIDRANVINKSVSNALLNMDLNEKFDIVFMDPPYDADLYVEPMKILSGSNNIDKRTIIIIESSKNDEIKKVLPFGYEIFKEKNYKNNKHTFLRKLKQ